VDQKELNYYVRKDKEFSREGRSVLGTLIEDANFKRADQLLENGFSFKSTDSDLLLRCASIGEPECIPYLVKKGFDPNYANEAGETALHIADSGPMARALLRAGASPNTQDCHGNTPLHHAHNAGKAEALLEYGADIRLRNQSGKTPSEALKTWTRAEYGDGGYEVVERATEARKEKDAMLSALSHAWKPSDCKEACEPANNTEPAQKRRRLM
jgi:hypothetical protein